MLAINRRFGQSITMRTAGGETIVVQVVKTGRHQIVLGIDAPRSVRIVRTEIEGLEDAPRPINERVQCDTPTR